jgi:chloramphenicol 3-O phosphotransferase
MSQIGSQSGRIIILNGGSSAGKTTLARALQARFPEPWLLLGIDLFIWTLPPDLINDPTGLSVRDGVITRGDTFLSLYSGFQAAVAALCRTGVNVLLDDVALDGAADPRRWNDALEGLEVFWIGVRCDPEIATKREMQRRSRLPGVARHHALSVHSGVSYDVEVDSGHLALPEEISVIADALTRRWEQPMSPRNTGQAALPPLSAWIPGEAIPPPPWEV